MSADSDPSATNVTHQSGGADLNAGRDINVGGDVVGRDKIVDESITTGDIKNVSGNLVIGCNVNVSVNSASRGVTVDEYLAAVREYCANLPYLTLHDIRPPKTLDEVYVPLKARPQPRKYEEKSKEEQECLERETFRLEPLSIADVMQQRTVTRVLIIGEPGAGKSTLLRQMAERAWDAPQAIGLSERHLPLLVPLRQLASTGGSLNDRLNNALKDEIALPRNLPAGFLDEWSQQTGAHWLILFDALDEVQDKERARLMQWLRGQLPHLYEHRVVITSRPTGYRGDFDAKTFSHYDLLPFTPEQANELARKWFADKARTFLQELDRIRTGDLRSTPLLLTIAAKVFGERDTLPERRSELYQQFVMIWLNEARQRDEKHELSERFWDIAVFVLARLALAMVERPELVSERPISRVVADYLGEALGLKQDEAEVNGHQIVSVLGRRSGVFTKRGDEYRFFHPALRDYLASVAVVRMCRDDPECAWQSAILRWQESDWREVSLFALSLLSDDNVNVTPLLQRIKWIDSKEATYFSGMALREPIEVPADFAVGIIEALVAVAQESYWDALTTLTLLEEIRAYPQALEGLRTLSLSARIHPWIRAEAAEVLGERGRVEEAAYAWMLLVRDKKADGAVHEESIEALLRLGCGNELLTLARDKEADNKLRVQIAKMLYKLGYSNELLLFVHGKTVDVAWRAQAVEALRQLGCGTELLAILHDETVYLQLRLQAAKALGQIGHHTAETALVLLALACRTKSDNNLSHEFVTALVHLLPNGDLLPLVHDERADASAKLWVIETLGELKCRDDLFVLAHDGQLNIQLRAQSVEALGKLGRGDDLLTLARDEQLDVRLRVKSAETLCGLGRGESLLAFACDEQLDMKLRVQSVEALDKLKRADDLLMLACDERLDMWLRVQSVAALSKLSLVEDAISLLLTLGNNHLTDVRLRETIADVLRQVGQPYKASVILLSLARDKTIESQTRSHAVQALGFMERIKDLKTLTAEFVGDIDLLPLVRDERAKTFVKLWALKMLIKLGRSYDLLELALDEHLDMKLRAQSVEALGKLKCSDYLLELARDKRIDAQLRQKSAGALAALGRGDDLLMLARDDQQYAQSPQKSADALTPLGLGGELPCSAAAASATDRDALTPLGLGGELLAHAETLGKQGLIEEATSILLALARKESADIPLRETSAKVLRQIGRSDEASAILLSLARDVRIGYDARSRAVRMLGSMGRSKDLMALVEEPAILEIGGRVVQSLGIGEQAVQSLGELGHYDDLMAIARNQQLNTWVRRLAVELLDKSRCINQLQVIAQDNQLYAWICEQAMSALKRRSGKSL